jgi:cbb3-type cytochrome oxidase maturation protein
MALLLGGFFLATFLFAVKSGQFDDLDTPAHRILIDDEGE